MKYTIIIIPMREKIKRVAVWWSNYDFQNHGDLSMCGGRGKKSRSTGAQN